MESRASGRSVRLQLVGIALLAIGVLLRVRPLSVRLSPLAPDERLEPHTAHFLDGSGIYAIGAGLLVLAASFHSTLRQVLAATWRSPPGSEAHGRAWIGWVAVATFAARVAVGVRSDVGLGDDGSRVIWLLDWLEHPQFVRTGLWAPGHLYLHALVWVVVRDAVRAGVVLGALASAGTVWLLGREVERTWGRIAGASAAVFVAVLPVSSAFGSTPDVNPVFAFLCAATVACAARASRTGAWGWLGLGWVCAAFASWSRFEAFLLVPAFALPLWPRWRLAFAFGLACALPALVWNGLLYLESGQALRVLSAVQADRTLAQPRTSQVFGFLGAWWQAVPLPVAVLGVAGMGRALRFRCGREYVPLVVLHLGSLLAATWSTGTGNQARYLILLGSILAAYTGVAVAAMLQRSRRCGGALLVLAFGLTLVLPSAYPDPGVLWIQRSARLRGVVDCVAAVRVAQRLQAAPVVWVADESAFFFACRQRIPVGLYHALSRADTDPRPILAVLKSQPDVLACVRMNAESERRWADFLQIASGRWACESLASQCSGYRTYRLHRAS